MLVSLEAPEVAALEIELDQLLLHFGCQKLLVRVGVVVELAAIQHAEDVLLL